MTSKLPRMNANEGHLMTLMIMCLSILEKDDQMAMIRDPQAVESWKMTFMQNGFRAIQKDQA